MDTGIVFTDKTSISGDGTVKHPLALIPPVFSTPVDLIVYAPGVGSNNQVLVLFAFSRIVKFPSGAALSQAIAKVAATADTVFTFSKNGTPFATVDFGIAATIGTYTQAADEVFSPGDTLEIDGPAVADATLADIGFTFAGLR